MRLKLLGNPLKQSYIDVRIYKYVCGPGSDQFNQREVVPTEGCCSVLSNKTHKKLNLMILYSKQPNSKTAHKKTNTSVSVGKQQPVALELR